MAIIAQVLEYYGAYSATLEREFIQAQQRPAVPLPPVIKSGSGRVVTPRVQSLRQTVLRCLRDRPGVYLTAAEIGQALGEDSRRVHYTIGDLVQEGFVRPLHRDRRCRPQKYAAR